ncbi:hypothetical protein Tco_1364738, partial [Tanacetum coccineum]
MTHATSSSGLVPNPVPQQPFNPLTRNDWGRLFQPMFDEYFNPPSSDVSLVPVATAPRAVDLAGSPSSTTIDQYAPSSSTSSTIQQQQSSIISQGVEEPIPNALFNDPCHKPLHDVSTSRESSLNMQSSNSPLELIYYYSNNQYAVSIKEHTTYPCLHSPKTTKEKRSIRRIQERQYAVFKLYGNKIFQKISNVVPTPRNSNTPYPR